MVAEAVYPISNAYNQKCFTKTFFKTCIK
jgi:hypothetical protein